MGSVVFSSVWLPLLAARRRARVDAIEADRPRRLRVETTSASVADPVAEAQDADTGGLDVRRSGA